MFGSHPLFNSLPATVNTRSDLLSHVLRVIDSASVHVDERDVLDVGIVDVERAVVHTRLDASEGDTPPALVMMLPVRDIGYVQGEALRADPEVLQSSGIALRVDVGVRSVIGVGVFDRKALRRAASRAPGTPVVPAKRNLQSPAVQLEIFFTYIFSL